MMRGIKLTLSVFVLLVALVLPASASQAAERMAVVDGRDVVLVDADGSRRRVLTTVPERNAPPHAQIAWSPNARFLAVTRVADDRSVVRVYDRSTNKWHEAGTGAVTAPTWSPTSRRLAFGVGNGRIRIVNVFTQRRRTFDVSKRAVTGVHWAPAGKRLAVLVAAPRGVGQNLLTMNLKGNAVSRLTRAQKRDGGAAGASWSPDGSQIVFARYTLSYEASQLVVANADGSGKRRLTKSTFDQFDTGPAWSPLGGEIAFTRDRSVQVVSAAGGSPRRVVRGAGFDVSWSPDGLKLALLGRTAVNRVQAFAHDIGSGELTQLTTSGLATGVAFAP